MIKFIIALGAGFSCFLSSCLLPLILGYVSFNLILSLQEISKFKETNILAYMQNFV